MGISAVTSYIGGALIDTVDLAPEVIERCFPTAAAWPGRTTLDELGERIIRRREAAVALPPAVAGREPRLPDPGFARFRADGEAHLFAPRVASEIQLLSGARHRSRTRRWTTALGRYREALRRRASGRGDAA